jgi:tetratricopeptide (TPR) repeat protein
MVKLFFSYSHRDESLRDELEIHLSALKRQGVIETWHDRRIGAGKEFDSEISENLETAQIILLLVSPYFIASDYCYDIEMTRALERHKSGEARVIAVILHPCDWHSLPFGKLTAIPKDGKPISNYPNQHDAFLEVSLAIRTAAKDFETANAMRIGLLDLKDDHSTTPVQNAISSAILERDSKAEKNEANSASEQQNGSLEEDEINIDERIDNIRSAIKKNKKNAQLYANLGALLLQVGDWKQAFKKANELKPRVAGWHYKQATAYEESQEWHKAESSFSQAIALDEHNVDFRVHYARLLSNLKKWSETIRQLEYVLHIAPRNEEANKLLVRAKEQHELAEDVYSKGRELESSSHLNEAFECYRRANYIEVNYADATSRMASIISRTDREHRLSKINESLSKEPDKADWYLALGKFYLEENNLAEAEAAFKRVQDIEPNSAQNLAYLGRIYHSQEKWEDAKAAFTRAVELNPESSERHFELAAAAYAQTDWNTAISHYEAAIKLSPSDILTMKYRKYLERARRQIVDTKKPSTNYFRVFIGIVVLSTIVAVILLNTRSC